MKREINNDQDENIQIGIQNENIQIGMQNEPGHKGKGKWSEL